MTEEVPWEYDLSIEKLAADSNGDLYIAGFASNGNEDEDGEIMDLDSLRSVYKQYMQNPVIKLMHDKVPQWKGAIGKVVPDYTDVDGNIHKTSFSSKPYLVIKLARGLPEWIYSSIKDGTYKGLSIGGKLAKRVGNRLYVKSWLETSIVDIPSAKGSFVNVLKAAGESVEPEIPSFSEIEKGLNTLEEIIKIRKLSEANSYLDTFLKGGEGSGIKGHTTYHSPEELREKYKKDSQELNAKYKEAMGNLDSKEKEAEGKLDEIQHALDATYRSGNTGERSRLEGERDKARGVINSIREKKTEYGNRHSEAQAKLSEDLMANMRNSQPESKKIEPGLSELQASMRVLTGVIQSEGWKTKSESDRKAILNAVQRTQEQIDRIQDKISQGKQEERMRSRQASAQRKSEEKTSPNIPDTVGIVTGTTPEQRGEKNPAQPAIDKEEAKKQARRERAKKRREAKKSQESKPTEAPKGRSGGLDDFVQRTGGVRMTGASEFQAAGDAWMKNQERTAATPVGEGPGTSKDEERKAKRRERAAKRRAAKKMEGGE